MTCATGVLRRLCTHIALFILPEPYTINIQAPIWIYSQHMGPKSIGFGHANHHVRLTQLKEETSYQIRENESYGKEIGLGSSGRVNSRH